MQWWVSERCVLVGSGWEFRDRKCHVLVCMCMCVCVCED